MDFLIAALVFVIQLVLAGFVMWGGWLCLRDGWLRDRAAKAASAEAKDDGFERVASLVLLALLCTTLIGAV
ncbi:MAG TPA: hypothetical protein VM183_05900 [Burkholderiales bacterium]|nr:hypothetical protein [Burkholderiales bacterium]